MNPHPRIAAYLDAVTSSLEGDDELRLDVRAELAAHLEEATLQLQAEGHSPEESAELAIRSLGPATDYAADLIDANRRRMRPRARLRLFIRALVIPASIVATLVSLHGCAKIVGVGLLVAQGTGLNVVKTDTFQWLLSYGHQLSPEQRLIVYGAPNRANAVATQRAIWEAWPTNIVYLNNYLTTLLANYATLGSTPAEQFAALDRELERARALDPSNARYLYMRAAKQLELGAKVDVIDLGKDPQGNSQSDHRLVVHDRAVLDQAMAEFLAGTRQPILRRYSSDMLQERLTIMGPPNTLLEQIREVSVAAGTLFPDLSAYRSLARASEAYARLLIEEGRPNEARPFIDAWQPLCMHVAEDSFTLIDVLVAGAIARIGQTNAVARYRALNDPAAAARARETATALSTPVTDWRTRTRKHHDSYEAEVIRRHGSVLTGLLLPALGESVTADELKAGRMVEYVLLDQEICGIINLILVVIMIGALQIVLRWRHLPGSTGVPLLLLPDTRRTLRTLGYAVVLPIGVYGVWTWFTPLGGRGYSLVTAWPLAVTQAVLLATAIVTSVVTLSTRAIRARCDILNVPTPPPGSERRLLWSIATGGSLLLAFAYVLVLRSPDVSVLSPARIVFGVCLAAFVIVLILAIGTALSRHLFGAKEFGFYRGTVARSLIPHLAMAIALITLLTHPYLRATETRLIRTDPIMALSQTKTCAGFSVAEARLVERLRSEMLRAAGR